MEGQGVSLFATPDELNDPDGQLQFLAFPVYVPENQYGIPEGEYSRNEFVRLLRENCRNPELVYFLADMLEG